MLRLSFFNIRLTSSSNWLSSRRQCFSRLYTGFKLGNPYSTISLWTTVSRNLFSHRISSTQLTSRAQQYNFCVSFSCRNILRSLWSIWAVWHVSGASSVYSSVVPCRASTWLCIHSRGSTKGWVWGYERSPSPFIIFLQALRNILSLCSGGMV